MTRYLAHIRFIVLFLICINNLYALDKEIISDEIKKYFVNLPYDRENIITKTYDIKTSTKKFILVSLFNWQNDELGRAVDRYSCIGIFDNIKMLQSFCFSDNIGKVENKKNFFTITSLWQDRIGNFTNTYLTFKLINDKFYLYQYSKEEGNIDAVVVNSDEKTKRMKEVIENTSIYYRQPRDDPKKEKLILLDDVNDELLQKLSKNANEN